MKAAIFSALVMIILTKSKNKDHFIITKFDFKHILFYVNPQNFDSFTPKRAPKKYS